MDVKIYKTDNGYSITNERNESRLEPGRVMLTYSEDDKAWRVQKGIISPGTVIQERNLQTNDLPLSSIVQDVKTIPIDFFSDIAGSYMKNKSGCIGALLGKKQPLLAEYVFKEIERLSKA